MTNLASQSNEVGHTPGPWECSSNPSNTCEVIRSPARPDAKIAEVHSYKNWLPDKGERKANAHLIAASPDLYAELQQFVNGVQTRAITSDHDETLDALLQRSLAALSRARGEA